MSALERLEPLVGEWEVSASLAPDGPTGRMTLEWDLGGRFLLQRTSIPVPEAPEALSVISVNTDGETYTQHYFDSRGVVRVYAMRFDGREWLLIREKPDFTPLAFAQRYTGTLSEDGRVIEGRWEMWSAGAAAYELDFELTYTKLG